MKADAIVAHRENVRGPVALQPDRDGSFFTSVECMFEGVRDKFIDDQAAGNCRIHREIHFLHIHRERHGHRAGVIGVEQVGCQPPDVIRKIDP